MAATASPPASEPVGINPIEAEPKPLKVQPLWRFALIGLGPLAALGVFALLVALFQHLT